MVHVLSHSKRPQTDMMQACKRWVADFAAGVHRPGKEKNGSYAKVIHREKIILCFEVKVAEFGPSDLECSLWSSRTRV